MPKSYLTVSTNLVVVSTVVVSAIIAVESVFTSVEAVPQAANVNTESNTNTCFILLIYIFAIKFCASPPISNKA